jgi:hypothetical protein
VTSRTNQETASDLQGDGWTHGAGAGQKVAQMMMMMMMMINYCFFLFFHGKDWSKCITEAN